MKVTLSEQTFAGTFQYFKDGSKRGVAHCDPYVWDIDGDGIDEVIFGGLESQPNTPSEFSPITLHIFGWEDGVFQDLSDKWLPNGAGDVDGAGELEFGDFNSDGSVDIFVAGYADMEHSLNPYVLYNQGGWFEKTALPLIDGWQHGSTTGDVNQDGFTDVVATGYGSSPRIYLGGPSGLREVKWNNFAGGSDIVIGDFLGDQSIAAIYADYWHIGADTTLTKIVFSPDADQASNVEIGLLPAPILENLETTEKESHDVRIEDFDFNADGLSDVVLYSRLAFDGQTWPQISALQFLQNQGNGTFIDVTADILVGYSANTMPPYAPVIRDLNKDGLTDLFVDGPTFTSTIHNSAAFLMQSGDGKFVDTARSLLSSQIKQIGGMSTVAFGPDEQLYLITLLVGDPPFEPWGGNGHVYIQSISFPDRDLSENLTGTQLAERILGQGGNDLIYARGGDDILDGGVGIDTALFANRKVDYEVAMNDRVVSISSEQEGNDQLTNVERLKFADISLALDVKSGGNAGNAAKLLGALWGKESVQNPAYVGIVLHFLDSGTSYENLLDLALGALLGPNKTNNDVAKLVYRNLIGEAPTETKTKELASFMDSGAFSQAAFTRAVADLEINATNIDLVGLANTGLQYVEYVG